jgi:hypothetical protein
VKVTFDIPDWAIGRHIHIFAGVELLGQMEFRSEKIKTEDGVKRENHYMPLKMKVGRCNGCGDCCGTGGSPFSFQLLEEIKQRLMFYEHQGTGTACPLLGDSGCILGSAIPFQCASSNCEGWSENCTEKLVADDDIKLEVL